MTDRAGKTNAVRVEEREVRSARTSGYAPLEDFLPARASVGHKWKRIDRAFHRTEDLPPVKLYKLEEAYFVVDGHHRVSVARYHDVPTVEAAVVEFHPSSPLHQYPELRRAEADILERG